MMIYLLILILTAFPQSPEPSSDDDGPVIEDNQGTVYV